MYSPGSRVVVPGKKLDRGKLMAGVIKSLESTSYTGMSNFIIEVQQIDESNVTPFELEADTMEILPGDFPVHFFYLTHGSNDKWCIAKELNEGDLSFAGFTADPYSMLELALLLMTALSRHGLSYKMFGLDEPTNIEELKTRVTLRAQREFLASTCRGIPWDQDSLNAVHWFQLRMSPYRLWCCFHAIQVNLREHLLKNWMTNLQQNNASMNKEMDGHFYMMVEEIRKHDIPKEAANEA